MQVLIVTSTTDPASVNIYTQLLDLYDFSIHGSNDDGLDIHKYKNIYLTSIPGSLLTASYVEQWVDSDLIIFPSRHTSSSKKPSLTIHPIGNFNTNVDLGGKPNKLSVAPSLIIKNALISLWNEAKKFNINNEYDVILEATHHGDYLNQTPCFFIEIGSTLEDWTKVILGQIVAHTIINTSTQSLTGTSSIAIGGPHYPNQLTQAIIKSDLAIGHIASKHSLKYIDEKMILEMVNRTTPKPNIIIVDWKGLGTYKSTILSTLDKLGLEWRKIKYFF